MEQLARWWSKKYKLPWNHELFQERTIFDLYVEYWLDVFEEKPLEAHRNPDGFIQLKDTGDDLIDRWEATIASGEEPDLTEAFSPEAWERIHQIRARAKNLNIPSRGMTMKETMDRVEKDSRLLEPPKYKKSISTFGDGFD